MALTWDIYENHPYLGYYDKLPQTGISMRNDPLPGISMRNYPYLGYPEIYL